MNETPRPSFSLRDILTQIRRRLPWWPTKPTAPVADRYRTARVQAQLDVITRAFDREFGEGSVATAGGKDGGDGEFDYLYHPRRMLVRDGIQIRKYWFSISDAEQEKRFQQRSQDPLRRWKLSPMDIESRARWVDYSRAKDEMFLRTHTPEAPWYTVEGDDKRSARLTCIGHLLSTINYQDVLPPPIELPPLPKKRERYKRPPRDANTILLNA